MWLLFFPVSSSAFLLFEEEEDKEALKALEAEKAEDVVLVGRHEVVGFIEYVLVARARVCVSLAVTHDKSARDNKVDIIKKEKRFALEKNRSDGDIFLESDVLLPIAERR